MKKQILNRVLYKKVKKMDRQEMENFLAGLYHEAFQAGVESAEKTDLLVEVGTRLINVKGIGNKTYGKIINALRESLENEKREG